MSMAIIDPGVGRGTSDVNIFAHNLAVVDMVVGVLIRKTTLS